MAKSPTCGHNVASGFGYSSTIRVPPLPTQKQIHDLTVEATQNAATEAHKLAKCPASCRYAVATSVKYSPAQFAPASGPTPPVKPLPLGFRLAVPFTVEWDCNRAVMLSAEAVLLDWLSKHT